MLFIKKTQTKIVIANGPTRAGALGNKSRIWRSKNSNSISKNNCVFEGESTCARAATRDNPNSPPTPSASATKNVSI